MAENRQEFTDDEVDALFSWAAEVYETPQPEIVVELQGNQIVSVSDGDRKIELKPSDREN